MNILFLGAEAAPFVKVGGLGDVTGSLPPALLALPPEMLNGETLDVRLAIPYHSVIPRNPAEIKPEISFTVYHPHGAVQAEAYSAQVGGLKVYLIDGEPIQRSSTVYSSDSQVDGEKYAFFSLAALELCRALDWSPDILHANDWHTALAVHMLTRRRKKERFFKHTRSILTIHNLPYMGVNTEKAQARFGIPPSTDPRLPDWGRVQPLPMGMAAADFITAVSPTYSREILTPEFGCGLETFLRSRADSLAGILNGLDLAAWDPATDTAIPHRFSAELLDERNANKTALQEEFGLEPNPDVPLMIFISRMDYQKGVDLAVQGLRQINDLTWQAILLGTGDPALEAVCLQLETEMPQRVRAALRFDTKLSRRMYAGGDMLLMPSRYEPCGLAQMIAMRYGCLPVARSTGGLRDTILDSQEPQASTGFLFEDSSADAMAAALRRSLTSYQNRSDWKERQQFAMQQDFSWQRSALAYLKIYQELTEARP